MQALHVKEQQKDLLNFAALPSIKKVLLPKETIVFSGEIFKHYKGKKMKRRIFMTNIHFFTLGKKSNLIQQNHPLYLVLTGNVSIKRRIPYKNFQILVSAKKSSELLIQTSNFEIRMATADKYHSTQTVDYIIREGIIQYVIEGYWEQANQDFPIYYIDDFTLDQVQLIKGEKRKEYLKTVEVQQTNPSKLQVIQSVCYNHYEKEQINQTNQVSAKLFESLVDSLVKFDLDGPLTRKVSQTKFF